MAVPFTIKPVARQEEIFAAALIIGPQVAIKQIDTEETTVPGSIAKNLTLQAMCNPRFSFFAAYSDTGAALGYICGELRESIYVPGQINSYELLWVVADQHRRSGVGLALLDAWESHCKEKGCKHVYMGLSAHTQPEILRKIYAARGYTLHSESYSKTF
jgi:GNAT superfamily N-acetyltransferase